MSTFKVEIWQISYFIKKTGPSLTLTLLSQPKKTGRERAGGKMASPPNLAISSQKMMKLGTNIL